MKEKIDDYLQDFYTVDQNYNTITMMKEKKNMVVTYRKDKFLDELWIDWQMLIPV